VSNVHMAEHVIECGPDVTSFEAPWRIELPQGGVIRGEGQQGGWPIAIDDQPANRKIVQLGTRGAGQVVQDNAAEIDDALFEQSGMTGTGAAEPEPPATGVPIGGGSRPGGEPGTGTDAGPGGDDDEEPPPDNAGDTLTESSDGGCTVARAGAGDGPRGLWLLLLAAAVFAVRRSRHAAGRESRAA